MARLEAAPFQNKFKPAFFRKLLDKPNNKKKRGFRRAFLLACVR